MANKRADTLELRLRIETWDVKAMHLGVTLPDSYILIKDEDTNWAGWHDIEGSVRVCHTDQLQEWEKRLVQFLITKPLKNAQPPPPPSQLPTALWPCVCGTMPTSTWTL